MKTLACIRTMECGYAICSTFLPGDRQVAVGTKSGEIFVYDVASSSLLETVKAHTSTVWSMHVRADGQALVTGSADKDVKFWEFEQKPVDTDNVSPQCNLLADNVCSCFLNMFSPIARGYCRLSTYVR